MELTSSGHQTAVAGSDEQNKPKGRNYSIFRLPSNFVTSIESFSPSQHTPNNNTSDEIETTSEKNTERWTCHSCKYSFDSLIDQRSHFNSHFHRFNIKLSIAGKDTIKEGDFNEWNSNSLVKDDDITSSISDLKDEDNRESGRHFDSTRGLLVSTKQKVIIRLPNGEMVSCWKCLLLGDNEKILVGNDLSGSMKDDDTPFVTVGEVVEKFVNVIKEHRYGHFAGCVFDGNTVVTHKTFHRYVVRATAGRKQSSEDAGGKIAHSAGASIRRHNEVALKKSK